MPNPNAVVLPQQARITVRLDQVQHFIHSLVLISRNEALSGLDPWIYETAGALSSEERETHQLVMIGLHYAVLPRRDWEDVPAYLDHLEDVPAEQLRDRVLDTYLSYGAKIADGEDLLDGDRESLLGDVEYFLAFLVQRFGEALVEEPLERRAHALLVDPDRLQEVVLNHLRMMWEDHFQAEWDRIQPMLTEAVEVFAGREYDRMTRREAAEYITGQALEGDKWDLDSEQYGQLVFVPSGHTGPYKGRFEYKNALGVMFGARLPRDAKVEAPSLSRNEIVVRLGALADDTRLQILKLVAEEGELRSGEIMEAVGLSQSAASRHLKQLSASGYLAERRCSNAKCYRLNGEYLKDTLAAVSGFLLE
jgi:DNA-binding transcriptional ArsR family regulator